MQLIIDFFRIKKVARSSEELIVKDATTRREINPTPQIYPDVHPTSRQFQPQTRIEPKKNHEFQSGSQQQQKAQQQHRYNRGHSRHPAKRVKTRSIGGLPTYEVSDNQIDSIPEVIHDEGPIRIEPMLRVTTKKNVFDSIIDILHQLLDPPKNEPGPLVPIQMPGSKRKIYLRLIEPLDASQVIVRFVTQLPVPVIDAEKQYNPFIPIPSIVDPITMLMNQAHHGIHPVLSGDPLFSSSSNRHRVIYPPRNVSHVKGLQSSKPLTTNSLPNPSKDPQIKGSSPPAIVSNEAESNKNHLTNTRVNLQNHEQQLLSESAASYYQYQAAGEEVMNKVKELLEKENATTTIKSEADPSVKPWYQLSTHRLPLRQIASYSPAPVKHGSSSSSYTDTYKAPSDVLTGPSSYPTSYEQYNDAANSAPGFYPSSYSGPSSYSTPYKQNEIHDTHPNTYSTSYYKQEELNNVPSSYSVYQDQNEFNSAPSSYSASYQSQNEYSAPDSYATSYGKQNDLFSASSAYSSSYEKPTPPSSSFYDKQTGASSNDALEVIDPPSYLPGYRMENQANRSFATTSTRQPRYSLHETVHLNTGGESASPVIWGKSKREKDKSSFQKSAEITGIDDNREKWQPVVFVHENVGWHEAYEAELAKTATTERQPVLKDRPTKKLARGAADQTRRNVKQRGGGIVRDPRCSTVSGDGCEQKKSTTTSTTTPRSESTIRIVEKQAQSAVTSEPILITKSATNLTIETLKPNVTTKSPTISTTMTTLMTTTMTNKPLVTTTKSPESMSVGTTERSPLLIKVIKSTTTEKPSLLIKAIEDIFMSNIAEKLKATEASVIKPTVSNMKKLATSSTTEKSSTTTEKTFINSPTKMPSNKAKKSELPKRPMIMKKSTYIVKRPALSSTTRRTVTTQKPTISSTTKKTTVKSKFLRTTSKRKSSTT